jgi:hypothetical protein
MGTNKNRNPQAGSNNKFKDKTPKGKMTLVVKAQCESENSQLAAPSPTHS